jgi:hypothetical protein
MLFPNHYKIKQLSIVRPLGNRIFTTGDINVKNSIKFILNGKFSITLPFRKRKTCQCLGFAP